MADLKNQLVTYESLELAVQRMKEYTNQFEPRTEIIDSSKLTYTNNYIKVYCDYTATVPAVVRIADDYGNVLVVSGSANQSWKATKIINSDVSNYPSVFYASGYLYIQVNKGSYYTVFGGTSTVTGSKTGIDIPVEEISADVDLSEYAKLTDIPVHDNKNVLDLLTESDTGKLQYNGITIGGEGGASTADAVAYSNDAISVTNVEEALNKLIADYYYVAPSVASFTASPSGGTFEIGSTITAPITFNWNYNKDITTQTLTDCTLADETVRTATYNTDITSNKTFTLAANDGKNNVSKNVSYSFTNKVWYGSASEGTYDDTFILGLATGKLQTSKSGTYTVTVADREYFFIAMPQSYNNADKLVGKIGGFETEFGRVSTVSHTNASGYTTNYNIYKSTNASLGAISFII